MPETPTTYSGRKPLGRRDERVVVADDDLRHAVAIAEVDEHERAEVADAVHPAEQHDILSGVGSGQRAAGVGPGECAETVDIISRESSDRQRQLSAFA